MTAVGTPLLAYFVFEPYLALFSVAAIVGTIVGLVFGAISARFYTSSWLKVGLLIAALPLTFALALALQSLPGLVRSYAGASPSWAMFMQSSGGFLFGWGLCAMVETYYRIFERSGRLLAWGLLALRIGGILLLLTILANPVWKQKNIDPGRVVVVLDDSRSMSLTDSSSGTRYHRAKAAVSQLTRALEAIPTGPRVAVDLYDVNGDNQAEPLATPTVRGMSLVERVKPGAEELAVNSGATVSGKPAVVAVVQRASGGGQVMVLTVDSTWLWSRLPRTQGRADTLYGRFWGQTVRWLASRGRDERRPPLTVFPDKPYYEVGKRVLLTIKRQPRADVDLSATQVSLEIIGPDGQPLPLERTPTPRASSGQPDVFTAEFTPSVSGRYEVNATLNADGKVLSNQTTEFRAQGADYKLADEGNPETLKALAKATGGLYLDVDQADKLADKIAREDRMGPEHRE
jgi:hypothetical protein